MNNSSFKPAKPGDSVPSSVSRITSVDFVRGVAMILMAIDHVRVYSGVPAGGSTPGIFDRPHLDFHHEIGVLAGYRLSFDLAVNKQAMVRWPSLEESLHGY